MPNKIKSHKQWNFLAGIAHGMKSRKGVGPSPEVAKEMIAGESKKKRKALMSK